MTPSKSTYGPSRAERPPEPDEVIRANDNIELLWHEQTVAIVLDLDDPRGMVMSTGAHCEYPDASGIHSDKVTV